MPPRFLDHRPPSWRLQVSPLQVRLAAGACAALFCAPLWAEAVNVTSPMASSPYTLGVQYAEANGSDTSTSAASNSEPDRDIQAQPVGQWTGLWTRSTLFGSMGGLRPALGAHGITLNLTETSEYLNNVSGGMKRGGTYDGLTTADIILDTNKAFGWQGGTFNISGLQIHGRNLSQYNVGALQTSSGIEADNATRLWELWYQQSMFDDRMDIRVGQQSLDQEFMNSPSLALFVNTMFGWPALPSYDMPSGGPAYPLSALGVRLHYKLGNNLNLLAGVFDGNSTGADPSQDSQLVDRSGTKFNLRNGRLFIGEIQYSVNQPSLGDLDTGESPGLPGVYKLGFWYNTNRFDDQGYDTGGMSLAAPDSTGQPYQHRGNYSIYALMDQTVWRQSFNSPRTLNVFARVMSAPGDRNLISFSANAGVVLHAPFAGRTSDAAGLGLGYVKVGSHAVDLDEAAGAFNGGFAPVRNSETFVEATYQYSITPWWNIQADAQYTFNVGGGIANPYDPTQKVANSLVIGARTNIIF